MLPMQVYKMLSANRAVSLRIPSAELQAIRHEYLQKKAQQYRPHDTVNLIIVLPHRSFKIVYGVGSGVWEEVWGVACFSWDTLTFQEAQGFRKSRGSGFMVKG